MPLSGDSEAVDNPKVSNLNSHFDSDVIPAAYLQSVDHFSDDSRAMSPRSWGQFHLGNQPEPSLPQVSFGNDFDTPDILEPESNDSSPFRTVESSKVKEPAKFFEDKPLKSNEGSFWSDLLGGFSSPVPMELSNQEAADEASEERNLEKDSIPDRDRELETEERTQNPPLSSFDQTPYAREMFGDDTTVRSFGHSEQSPKFIKPVEGLTPNFKPELGHRYPDPIERGTPESSATVFPFEEYDQYPPPNEILAQSIFFSEFEYLFLQPSFFSNEAIGISGGLIDQSLAFNFDLESSFRLQAGFESDFGPGFAADYFQFDNESDQLQFVSDGIRAGEINVAIPGSNNFSSIIADDPGERINAFHHLELHQTSVFAFKAIKFKRAYINGRFGIQIVSIEQQLRSQLLNPNGSLQGELVQEFNFNAFGPRFGIDYVRRLGHTPAQLVVSTTSSLLFGDQDHFVRNSVSGQFQQLGSDKFVTLIDIFMGVQTKKFRGEKRNTTLRVGFVNQSWLGGGTAIDPDGDFGFQGISLMLGVNR